MSIKFSERGDTIVEVLLCMVIVASVLGGAYLSAGRSTAVNRQSQERGEALKMLEQQVERLNILVKMPTLPAAGTSFCINSAMVVRATSHADCKIRPQGTVEYTLSILRGSGAGNTDNYSFQAAWEGFGEGSADNQRINMDYRVSP